VAGHARIAGCALAGAVQAVGAPRRFDFGASGAVAVDALLDLGGVAIFGGCGLLLEALALDARADRLLQVT
jgi:hypothetical protein